MKINLENIASLIIRNRLIILIVILGTTILSIVQLKHLVVHNDLDIWIERSSDEYIKYNEFIGKFGNDESIILIYHSDSLLTNSHLRLNYDLTGNLSAIDGVGSVISLATISVPSNSVAGPRLTPLLPKSTSNPGRLRERFIRFKFLDDNLISSDLKTTSFTLILDSTASNIEVLEIVNDLGERYLTRNGEYVVYGVVPLKEELYKLSTTESKKFLILSILLILVLSFLLFRRVKEAILPLLVAIITISWTFGLISLMEVGVNVVISVLPMILVVISIAFSIHFISGMLRSMQSETDIQGAVIRTFSRVIKNCFFSALTTALALVAFSQSDISPLVNFGLFSALGVIIAFILTFSLMPIIYSFTGINTKRVLFSFLTGKGFSALTIWVNKHKKAIYSVCTIILIVSLFGVTRLEFSTEQITYFKTSNSVRVANEKVGEWFSGVLPIEVVFNLDTGIYDNPNKYISDFQIFENELSNIREIKSWQSPFIILNDIGMIENGYVKKRVVDFRQSEANDIFSHFVSEDGRSIRITLKASWLNDKGTLMLIDRVESLLENTFRNAGVTSHITGKAPVFAHLSSRLVGSQVRSLVIAFIMIMMLFLILYRSLRFAVLSIIPNILPVISTLGIMGLLKIPIDVATVLIASISLGIAIDDTIHFVGTYRSLLPGSDRKKSITGAYSEVGKPLIATTLLLICGFMVMVLSSYRPIIYMGIFISLNLLLALLSDLILLPAILLFKDKTD